MSLIKHSYKLKDGSQKTSPYWYYRFAYKGKTYFGSTDIANKTLAAKVEKQKYEELIRKHELGETASITVETAFNNYLSSVEHSNEYNNILTRCNKFLGTKKDHKNREKEVKIFGFDGTRLFDSLTTTDIQHLVHNRRKEGNSNGTILTELSTLSQCIKLNHKLGFPCPVIDIASIKKDNQIKPHKGKLRYLSKDEEAKLLAELNPEAVLNGIGFQSKEEIIEAREDIYDLVVVLLGTGARYSEIAELQWKDVDLKGKTINLYRSKVKNESTLQMTDRVYAVLNRRNESASTDYVFTCKDGSGPRKYAAKAFNNACKRAGIEGITLHGLRHTYASRLVQRGVSLYAVQSLLGHSSATTTQRYAHLAKNDAAQQAAMILNNLDKE